MVIGHQFCHTTSLIIGCNLFYDQICFQLSALKVSVGLICIYSTPHLNISHLLCLRCQRCKTSRFSGKVADIGLEVCVCENVYMCVYRRYSWILCLLASLQTLTHQSLMCRHWHNLTKHQNQRSVFNHQRLSACGCDSLSAVLGQTCKWLCGICFSLGMRVGTSLCSCFSG